MFFDANQTKGAIGAVVPEKAGGGQGAAKHLNQQQFGKGANGAPEEAAGAGEAAGADAAAVGGAAEAAGGAEALLPLLALA